MGRHSDLCPLELSLTLEAPIGGEEKVMIIAACRLLRGKFGDNLGLCLKLALGGCVSDARRISSGHLCARTAGRFKLDDDKERLMS